MPDYHLFKNLYIALSHGRLYFHKSENKLPTSMSLQEFEAVIKKQISLLRYLTPELDYVEQRLQAFIREDFTHGGEVKGVEGDQ
jgi:hypothetical protein